MVVNLGILVNLAWILQGMQCAGGDGRNGGGERKEKGGERWRHLLRRKK